VITKGEGRILLVNVKPARPGPSFGTVHSQKLIASVVIGGGVSVVV
jgi:hypothetical protein